MKHFVEKLFDNTYDSKIAEASVPLDTKPENIISIKLRPIRTNGNDEYENVHASDWDYEEFREYLNQNKNYFQDIQSDHFSALITTKNGEKLIYVEHESGPELIFDYSLKAIDFITTIGALILLVLDIIKRNDDNKFKKVNGKNRIEAISIEERKKGKKVKIKKIIRIEGVEKIELEIKEIIDLLIKLK